MINKLFDFFKRNETHHHYRKLLNLNEDVEHLFKKTQSALLRCFPLSSEITLSESGKTMVIEGFDLDNLVLKVLDLETGDHEELDYTQTLEWMEFYFKEKSKE